MGATPRRVHRGGHQGHPEPRQRTGARLPLRRQDVLKGPALLARRARCVTIASSRHEGRFTWNAPVAEFSISQTRRKPRVLAVRFVAAALMGAVIGYDRERNASPGRTPDAHPAWWRGSCSWSSGSTRVRSPRNEPRGAGTRRGIGFLGAGAILKRDDVQRAGSRRRRASGSPRRSASPPAWGLARDRARGRGDGRDRAGRAHAGGLRPRRATRVSGRPGWRRRVRPAGEPRSGHGTQPDARRARVSPTAGPVRTASIIGAWCPVTTARWSTLRVASAQALLHGHRRR